MGVMSKYHRFREAGEAANVNNVERFGEPVKSLFTTSKVFTLHKHIDITDDAENIVYQADTKFPSIHDKTDIRDAAGNQVAHMERKLLTLHERHFVTMADGTAFQISNELFHIVKDITNIEELGWQLRGNIAGLNFELYDADVDEVIPFVLPETEEDNLFVMRFLANNYEVTFETVDQDTIINDIYDILLNTVPGSPAEGEVAEEAAEETAENAA